MALAPWRNRIVESGEVLASELTANPRNARRHPPGQRAALAGVLSEVGWVGRVIVNRTSGFIVDGHLRVDEAAQRNEFVPVDFVELDEAEESMILALFDPIGALAETDDVALQELLGRIDTANPDVVAMIESLRPSPPLLTPEDSDASWSLSEKAVVQLGEVWLLRCEDGRTHRVMCGDSTDAPSVGVLMGGVEAHSMVTDPPYGIEYGDTVEFRRTLGYPQRAADDSYVKNDGLDDAMALWPLVFPLWRDALRRKGSAFYCWGPGGPQQIDLGVALRGAGLDIHGSIIWVKSSFSFSRAEHKYQHEPCFYGWRKDGTHEWYGPNNETSVWNFDKPHASELHPTQKPVDLIRRCVANVTPPGGVVIDPFLGSGTTIIAAHLEGRVGYGMELSPRYCDVILKRWQQLANVMPEREADGLVHDFTAPL